VVPILREPPYPPSGRGGRKSERCGWCVWSFLRASAARCPSGFAEARVLPEVPSTEAWGRNLDASSVPPVETRSWSAWSAVFFSPPS